MPPMRDGRPLDDDPDLITHPVLERGDLDTVAREPHDETPGAGWGGYYPGPEIQNEDEPVLATEHLEPTRCGVDPERPAYPEFDIGWMSPMSRDFRKEPMDYGSDPAIEGGPPDPNHSPP